MLKRILIVALVAVLAGALAEDAGGAHLIVDKKLVSRHAVATQDLAVNYRIYNLGESTAYDIVLEDDSFPKNDFEVTSGLTTSRWEKLAPGSNITHTLVVRPLASGYYDNRPAKISYRQSAKGQQQRGYSTTIGYFYVESYSDFAKRNAPHLKEWGIFTLLVATVTVPFAVQWRSSAANFQSTAKRTEKKRQ